MPSLLGRHHHQGWPTTIIKIRRGGFLSLLVIVCCVVSSLFGFWRWQDEDGVVVVKQVLEVASPTSPNLDASLDSSILHETDPFSTGTSLPTLDTTLDPHLYTAFHDNVHSDRFRLFPSSSSSSASDGDKKVLPVPILPQPCLHAWLTTGHLSSPACQHVTAAASRSSRQLSSASSSLPPALRVDVVWTWLNGSDPLWQEEKRRYQTHDRIGRAQGVPERHYRDHDELRASMRSVKEAFGRQHGGGGELGKFHVALTDWAQQRQHEVDGNGGGHAGADGIDVTAVESPDAESSSLPVDQRVRVGQRPFWLKGNDDVQLAWHSSFWSDFGAHAQQRPPTSRHQVLEDSLPTFNSFSIEANLFNLPRLAHQFVYLNDDFFLTAPHSMADFHSPFSILGPVMPFIFAERNYTFPPALSKENSGWWAFFTQETLPPSSSSPTAGFINSPPQIDLSCNHEWSSLARSNHLLGERFGHRHRPSHMHIPKPLLTPILHEVAVIWGPEHLSRSTTRRFREDAKTQPGDYNAVWLGETLLTERSREAMLWSWAVARLGQEAQVKGTWGRAENVYLRKMFGLETDVRKFAWWKASPDPQEFTLNLNRSTIRRKTLDAVHLAGVYRKLNVDLPKQTIIGWTYLDGPVPPLGASIRECYIDYRLCFGSWFTRAMKDPAHTIDAEAMFRRLAFEKPRCGDCLLSLLLSERSGELGIREILPTTSVVAVDQQADEPTSRQPHMPLTANWRDTDFSYTAITAGSTLSRLDFCEQLIARYAWSAAVNSSSIFSMIGSERALEQAIERIDHGDPTPASAAINDDLPQVGGFGHNIKERMGAVTRIERMFKTWLKEKWSKAGDWEWEND